MALFSFSAMESSTPEELKKRLTSILTMVISSGVDEECPICLDSLCEPAITHCAHVYCKKCIENVIRTDTIMPPRCPLCRGGIALDKLVEAPIAEGEYDLWKEDDSASSAKVSTCIFNCK